MISRRSFLTSTALTAGGVAALALGGPAMANEPFWYVSKSGFAADGADVVAYFDLAEDEKGVAGFDDHQTEWNGATWRFATAGNLAAFEADPEAYAPQYGGYCAWAVSQGYTAHGDINAWSVEGGKLYLNYNNRIRNRWLKDTTGFIASADANWPNILSA